MATRRSSFDDKLDRIHALRESTAELAAPELARLLADPNAYLVGEAAKVALELEARLLVPEIARAFERLLGEPASVDKGCLAKKRLLQTLIGFDADCRGVYYAGLKHEQLEWAMGKSVDTASVIRALSAHALVRMEVPGAALDVTPLLFDLEPEARLGAAEALANTGEELAAALLHAKVLAGDKEADVLGACYKGMLALAPRRYLPVVAAALEAGTDTAALALGESRLPEALGALKKALESGDRDIQDSVFLGIALLRTEEANDFLLEVVADAPEGRAASALGAIALHRHDARVAARARAAARGRKSKRILKVLEEKFGKGE
jgi:HEAT repeat protein